MMKKKLLRTMCGILAVISCCVGCSGKGDTFKEGPKNTVPPDYTKTETTVDMYAYIPPTNGHYTTEHDSIVYGESNITKERYQEYKDCGFNILLSDDEFYGGSMKTPTVESDKKYFETSQTKEILDLCQKVGLKAIVFDYRVWRLSRSETSLIRKGDVTEPLWFWCSDIVYYPEEVEYDATKKIITLQDGSQRNVDFVQYQFDSMEALQEYIKIVMSSYRDHPAFYGIRFLDEPSEAKLTAVGQTTKAIKNIYPECYVLTCLHPHYGPAQEPLMVATEEGFQEYLPMMFAAVKMAEGNFERDKIAKEFEQKFGYQFNEFMNLELPNITKEESSHFHDPAKYLLFNDPFIGLFDFTVRRDLTERYKTASEILKDSINGREYDYLFQMEKTLLDVLKHKSDLGNRLRTAYQEDDRKMLKEILEQGFPTIRMNLILFFDAFRKVWLIENKPFGLEVQEQRFGGLLYRMDMCATRLQDYLNGETDRIEELEENSLTKYKGFEEEAVVHNNWKDYVSTSVVTW